jgi:hypothetical protein
LRILYRALPMLALALWGCEEPPTRTVLIHRPPPGPSAAAKARYIEARDDCVSRYSDQLVEQSDCRTEAANEWIRPGYPYSDLMTRAQVQRRALAEQADAGQISREEFERGVAVSDAAISREEDRRNARRVVPVRRSGPGDPLTDWAQSIADLFR